MSSNQSLSTHKLLPYSREATFLERLIAKGRTIMGKCPICGSQTTFSFSPDFVEQLLAMGGGRKIIPPSLFLLRESLLCSICHSANRERQAARILLNAYSVNFLNELAELHILNTESNGALHLKMSQNPTYYFSEFLGSSYASGESVNGIRHEDIQHLSFADESLDVIITRDVFEHIPDPIWRTARYSAF